MPQNISWDDMGVQPVPCKCGRYVWIPDAQRWWHDGDVGFWADDAQVDECEGCEQDLEIGPKGEAVNFSKAVTDPASDFKHDDVPPDEWE